MKIPKVDGSEEIKKSQASPPDSFFISPDLSAKTNQENISTSNYSQSEENSKTAEQNYEKVYCAEVYEFIRDVLRYSSTLGKISEMDNTTLARKLDGYRKSKKHPKKYEFILYKDKFGFIKRIRIGNKYHQFMVRFHPDLMNKQTGKVNHLLDFIFQHSIQVSEDKTRRIISFSLDSLVDAGLYSSERAARTAVNSMLIPVLKDLELIPIPSKKADKEKLDLSKKHPLFPACKLEGGVVVITLNKQINWKLLFKSSWTYLPKGYFTLGSRSADFCHYIGYLCRQQTQRKQIAKVKGTHSFNLSWNTAVKHMYLPKEDKYKTRKLVNPILSAIDEIDQLQGIYYCTTDRIANSSEPVPVENSRGFLFTVTKEENYKKVLESNINIKVKAPLLPLFQKMHRELNGKSPKKQ